MATVAQFEKARDLYLKEEYPAEYRKLKQTGQLNPHLKQVATAALDLWETLESQMRNSPDLPENYLERVKMAEAIPEQVREMVNHDLIFRPPPK